MECEERECVLRMRAALTTQQGFNGEKAETLVAHKKKTKTSGREDCLRGIFVIFECSIASSRLTLCPMTVWLCR